MSIRNYRPISLWFFAGAVTGLWGSAVMAAEVPSKVTGGVSWTQFYRELGIGNFVPERNVLLAQAEPQKSNSSSRADALLGDIEGIDDKPAAVKLNGFDQLEAAYTVASPAHSSKFLNRFEAGMQGAFNENIKWKVSGRVNYDAIFDLNNFYPADVRHDQRYEAMLRENYLDISAGDLDFRLGRQHIVWGEVVGLFFADVVSARDLREFILPDFDLLRIPQWAARAEYFKNDFHAEAIWIPAPTVDNIGKPGAEFYPYPPPSPNGYAVAFNNEERPDRNRSNQNYGVRLSTLKSGWDIAAFGYHSVDASATFYRDIVTTPTPTFVYTPRHDHITQYGVTVAKDLRDVVLKAEAVYTNGRNFNVTRLSDTDGVVRQNFLDYILSFEFPLENDSRFNFQFFQRRFVNHDPDIIPDRLESGVSLYFSKKFGDHLEPQLLVIHSLNRSDWMARPKLVWNVEKNWRVVTGMDFFGGPATGLFGQFNDKDRIYAEVRRSF